MQFVRSTKPSVPGIAKPKKRTTGRPDAPRNSRADWAIDYKDRFGLVFYNRSRRVAQLRVGVGRIVKAKQDELLARYAYDPIGLSRVRLSTSDAEADVILAKYLMAAAIDRFDVLADAAIEAMERDAAKLQEDIDAARASK